jgi:hypothetical protein
MTTPAERVVTVLNAASLGLTFYARPVKSADDDKIASPMPHRAGFVETLGGNDKFPVKGGGNWLEHRIRVTITTAPEAYVTGETDAKAAYEVLDHAPFVPYYEIECDGTYPEWYGSNRDQQHRFTFFATLKERE